MTLHYYKERCKHANTYSDFDDLAVETVKHNNNITGICTRGVSSIMSKKKQKCIYKNNNCTTHVCNKSI